MNDMRTSSACAKKREEEENDNDGGGEISGINFIQFFTVTAHAVISVM
jgi:hypothetical protein